MRLKSYDALIAALALFVGLVLLATIASADSDKHGKKHDYDDHGQHGGKTCPTPPPHAEKKCPPANACIPCTSCPLPPPCPVVQERPTCPTEVLKVCKERPDGSFRCRSRTRLVPYGLPTQ